MTTNKRRSFLVWMIFEFDWNPSLFVARKSGLAEAVNCPNLTSAISPKYLFNETKIYIFITRIPSVVYRIFWGFFQKFIFLTSGWYLQTSALKCMYPSSLLSREDCLFTCLCHVRSLIQILPRSFSTAFVCLFIYFSSIYLFYKPFVLNYKIWRWRCYL